MLSLAKLAGLAALVPAVLACNAYTGGVPTATTTKTNSKVIEVPANTVYDGGWARFDRGSGACSDQSEGGKIAFSHPNTPLHDPSPDKLMARARQRRTHHPSPNDDADSNRSQVALTPSSSSAPARPFAT